ncbi:3-hydroxyacyl-ACP dehydratase FabZ [Candidatus Poriferisodalis sp.]|uniref:3-hydroxyacyl-ACP dehydratase FabZ n=1 Tax=Candidatus Poriferisodalis sp. TaxID=3101277 RepID=UPI003B01FBB6
MNDAVNDSASDPEFPRPADLLPHRAPFLLVDEIVELQPGERCVAHWHLTGDEAFFAGHFPGRPTLPGVLMVEALAQTAGLAAASASSLEGKLALFGGIDKARFRRQVTPGDTLRLEATIDRLSARAGRASGTASVEGQTACEASMMFLIADAADVD